MGHLLVESGFEVACVSWRAWSAAGAAHGSLRAWHACSAAPAPASEALAPVAARRDWQGCPAGCRCRPYAPVYVSPTPTERFAKCCSDRRGSELPLHRGSGTLRGGPGAALEAGQPPSRCGLVALQLPSTGAAAVCDTQSRVRCCAFLVGELSAQSCWKPRGLAHAMLVLLPSCAAAAAAAAAAPDAATLVAAAACPTPRVWYAFMHRC